MRSLLKTFGIALTLVGGLRAESRAAEAALRCPATARAGRQFTVEVTIDVGARPLGAYSVVVGYDPAVLTIASVAAGSTAEFPRPPTTNTITPGTTNVAALQTASLTSPTGVVSVARITFNAVPTASTTASIGLTVEHLFDSNATPILPATGTGCSVSVRGAAPPPTTSRTSTTVQPTTTTTARPRPRR